MNFEEFCKKYNIKEKTRILLVEADLNDPNNLACVTKEDLSEIGITAGQRIAIFRGIGEIYGARSRGHPQPDLPEKILNFDPDEIKNSIAAVHGSKLVENETSKLPEDCSNDESSSDESNDYISCESDDEMDLTLVTDEQVKLKELYYQCHIDEKTSAILKSIKVSTLQELIDLTPTDISTCGITAEQGLKVEEAVKLGRTALGYYEKKKGFFDKLKLKRLRSYCRRVFGKNVKHSIQEGVKIEGNLQIHSCPLRETWRDDERKIRTLVSGRTLDTDKCKTILLVGESGSGKSTLIDGMANYMFNIKFEENSRLQLVTLTEEEKHNAVHGQGISQTEWITVYTIPPAKETSTDYTLTIIDTPGFADTRGVERDEEIVKQIHYFFKNPCGHGVDMINGICFVAKACNARLSVQQKYVFEEILSMFGKDVKENIFIMATFADGNKPLLISSLELAKFPYTKLFPFNSSALFTPTQPGSVFLEHFWKLGMASYKNFFDELANYPPKSLVLTAELLQEREELQLTLGKMKASIYLAGRKQMRLEQEKETMKKHEQDIKENKNFTYEIDEEYDDKLTVPEGAFTTNCNECKTHCHDKCTLKNKDDKWRCWAMYKWGKNKGYCSQCPGHCHWEKHENHGYVITKKFRVAKRTFNEMKKRYDHAEAKVISINVILQDLETEIGECISEINELFGRAKSYTNRIREISLKSDPLSDSQYVNLMIHEEKKNQELGWEKRLTVLENIKQRADLSSAIQASDQCYNLLESLKMINCFPPHVQISYY